MSKIWVVALGKTGPGLVAGAKALAEEVVVVGLPDARDDLLPEAYAQPLAELLASEGAGLVLFAADTASRLLAGLVAGHAGVSPRPASGIELANDGTVTVKRMVYGGLAQAAEQVATPMAVVVAGPGALPAAEAAPAAVVPDLVVADEPDAGVKLVEVKAKGGEQVDLAAAKRVVGVGRGFAAQADLDLAKAVAAKLGAELACSRPIAEGVGWLGPERYVGVSGATLKPDLYIAVGISGQIQHMVGVRGAKKIVAINSDKDAPVFQACDLGVVGDLYQVLPALAEAL